MNEFTPDQWRAWCRQVIAHAVIDLARRQQRWNRDGLGATTDVADADHLRLDTGTTQASSNRMRYGMGRKSAWWTNCTGRQPPTTNAPDLRAQSAQRLSGASPRSEQTPTGNPMTMPSDLLARLLSESYIPMKTRFGYSGLVRTFGFAKAVLLRSAKHLMGAPARARDCGELSKGNGASVFMRSRDPHDGRHYSDLELAPLPDYSEISLTGLGFAYVPHPLDSTFRADTIGEDTHFWWDHPENSFALTQNIRPLGRFTAQNIVDGLDGDPRHSTRHRVGSVSRGREWIGQPRGACLG